jgi:hypothetical protein
MKNKKRDSLIIDNPGREFVPKNNTVQVWDWFELGDGPISNGKELVPLKRIERDRECKYCKYPLSSHGFMVTEHGPTTVCPGDVIIKTSYGFQVMHEKAFLNHFTPKLGELRYEE